MAALPPDSPPEIPSPTRRHRRPARRAGNQRGKSWFFAGLLSCVLAVGTIGFVGDHVDSRGTDGTAATASPATALAASTSSDSSTDLTNIDGDTLASTASLSTTTDAIADVNGDGTLRVLLVGDSLMWGAKDDITATLAAQGIEVQYFGWPGTGLLTNQTWWIDEIADAVTTFAPDTVVIESCCNYAGDFTLSDGTTVTADSQLMYDLWQTRAEQAVERAQAGGATVYVVLTPEAVPGADLDFPAERIDRFNAIYQQLGVELIDWNAVINDPTDATTTTELHEQDGLHLTVQGYAAVAQATVDQILGTTS